MKTREAKRTLRRAWAVLCVALLASFAFAGTAFAATVHGADCFGTGSSLSSGEIEVLNVDGEAGETVFLTVKRGDQTLAQNLPYTIGNQDSAEDGATWAGVATLDIANLDLNALDGSYTIEAYSDRAGSEKLYSGAIYGVYADLPDGTSKLIGTRTVDSKEAASRTFNASETLYTGGHTYRLAKDASNGSGEGALHFAYEEYDEATSVDGVIKFNDAQGNTIATKKIPGLAYGEERTIDIPSVVTADNGDVYRVVYFKNSVTAKNPGQTSFTIVCAKMSDADKALSGFYVATIQMVDENGRVIASDSVDVTGDFIYTAPSVIYKTEAAASASGEAAVVTYDIDQSPFVYLSAEKDGVLNRTRTVKVQYKAQSLENPETMVTFNYLDGSKGVKEEGRKLGSAQVLATQAEPVAEPPTELSVDGVTYHLLGAPSDYAYTMKSGQVPSIDVFYAPEGYTAPGAYDVTVNYVNFLTGTTVESHTYTTDPGENARILIESPETFSADGVDYVRLAGQENAIAHSYFSGKSTYTVYYRDVNDTLSEGTVINTIRVVYQGETEGAGTPAGVPGAGADGTAAPGAGDAQAMQLNDENTYNVFDGQDNNATLTNESGVDSNTERIEDSETPLASGFDKGGTSSAASSFMQMGSWLLPLGIAACVIVILAIIALVVIRRKNNEEYEA